MIINIKSSGKENGFTIYELVLYDNARTPVMDSVYLFKGELLNLQLAISQVIDTVDADISIKLN